MHPVAIVVIYLAVGVALAALFDLRGWLRRAAHAHARTCPTCARDGLGIPDTALLGIGAVTLILLWPLALGIRGGRWLLDLPTRLLLR